MDEILDQLKVLNYHRDFCKQGSFHPLNKFYFLIQAQNPNEQFYYFSSLFAWLLNKNGVSFDTPGQFDDPNATAAEMVSELKQMGISFEFGPHKLKQGYGEAVIYVLQALLDKLTASCKFQKPTHKNDDYPEEAEVDTGAEVTAETVEEVVQAEDDEDQVYVDTPASPSKSFEPVPPASPIRSKVDPAEWKLEVERVTPMLKVQIANDNKDWRFHIESMGTNHNTISISLSETKTQLGRIQTDIEKTLEKITSREKYINTQFESQIEETRVLHDQLSELRQKYNVANSSVNELSNELGRVSEELDAVKNRMDDIGNGMTDSQPLINIKKGISKLKVDIRQMDLRIGVIEHTLLQAKVTEE